MRAAISVCAADTEEVLVYLLGAAWCLCTHLHRLSCEHRDICALHVDGHSVRRQMLSAVEFVLIEATLLGFVQELVMPHC